MGVLRSNRHYAVDDATVLQDTISLADTQMPAIGWIDALRRYNLGGTSWCIPRRGTAEYEKVMMIRKGAEDVKPQPRRRTIKAKIDEEKPEPEPESHAEIPMVAEKAVNEMSDVYFHKDKFEYTIWRLDGDTFTQLADWNSIKIGSVPAGFVKTMARTRKTKDGGNTYLTPKDKKNVQVQPLRQLPSSPPRLQREVIAGLESLGYTKTIEFENTPTGEDHEAGEMKPETPKARKPKKVDPPIVLELLNEKKEVEEKRDQLVADRDAKKIPHDASYSKKLHKYDDRLIEIGSEIRRERMKHTKEQKQVAEKPVDRTEEINEQIKKELADGKVSVSYDLGWKPATKETIMSGGDRRREAGDYKWLLGLAETPDVMDLAKLQEIADMKETEGNADKIRLAKELLMRIKAWRPLNAYFGSHSNYDVKKGEEESAIKPALVDYKEFAEEVNKYRGTPIRNITYRSKFNPDGTRTMDMYWTITHRYFSEGNKKYHETVTPYYHRYYQLEPEFKVLAGSTTVKAMKEEEEKEEAEKAKAKSEKETKKAEKEKEKTEKEKAKEEKAKEEKAFQEKFEADPRVKDLMKKLQEVEEKKEAVFMNRDVAMMSKEDKKKEKEKFDTLNKEKEGINKQLKKIEKEMKK
jgi:hypothetical protein